MKKIAIYFLVALFVGVPGTVLAESSFDGVYVGFAAGFASGVDDGREFKDFGATDIHASQHVNPQGGLFSPFVGFNYVVNENILLGVEADYERRTRSDKNFQEVASNPFVEYPIRTRVIDAASLRARLGHVFNDDHTLAFVTAGYSMISIKRTYGDETNTIGNGTSMNITATQGGTTAGFGLEHLLTDKIFIRGEYRYANYGERELDTSFIYGTGTLEKQSFSDHSLRVGIAYNF